MYARGAAGTAVDADGKTIHIFTNNFNNQNNYEKKTIYTNDVTAYGSNGGVGG